MRRIIKRTVQIVKEGAIRTRQHLKGVGESVKYIKPQKLRFLGPSPILKRAGFYEQPKLRIKPKKIKIKKRKVKGGRR